MVSTHIRKIVDLMLILCTYFSVRGHTPEHAREIDGDKSQTLFERRSNAYKKVMKTKGTNLTEFTTQ